MVEDEEGRGGKGEIDDGFGFMRRTFDEETTVFFNGDQTKALRAALTLVLELVEDFVVDGRYSVFIEACDDATHRR